MVGVAITEERAKNLLNVKNEKHPSSFELLSLITYIWP